MSPRKLTKKQREALIAQNRAQAHAQFVAVGRLISLCVVAFLLDYLPIFSNILGGLETYFHEISHALMGGITGRTLEGMTLYLDGSGSVTQTGGQDGWGGVSKILTAWVGYSGAMAFGVCFYWIAGSALTRRTRIVLLLIALLIVLSLVWLAQDRTTWLMGVVLVLVFTANSFFLNWVVFDQVFPVRLFLRFLGAALVILSMKSVWALWSINPPHDASSLARSTLVFQFVWLASWELCGFASLYALFRREISLSSPSRYVG